MKKDNSIELYLNRTKFKKVQTLGTLIMAKDKKYISNDSNIEYSEFISECKTLELPWLDNHPFISCIPAGEYWIKRRWSPKLGNHLKVLDVPDRTDILIHSLNFYTQTQGCIGVGKRLVDINNDGWKDITNSRETLNIILSFLKWRTLYRLVIVNLDI